MKKDHVFKTSLKTAQLSLSGFFGRKTIRFSYDKRLDISILHRKKRRLY